MGFGKMFSGSNLKQAGLASVTGGASLLFTSGDAKNLLHGKKSQGAAAKYTPLEQEQQKALGLYNQQLDNLKGQDPRSMAEAEINQREAQIRAGADDQERQARDLVAQRGLNTSSVGLGAILGAKRDLNDRILQSRSMLPLLQNQYQNQQIDRLNAITGGVNNIYGSRMYTPGVQGGVRQGGLLAPILGLTGAAIGGYAGGPAGAAAGYQIGSGVGNAASNYRS